MDSSNSVLSAAWQELESQRLQAAVWKQVTQMSLAKPSLGTSTVILVTAEHLWQCWELDLDSPMTSKLFPFCLLLPQPPLINRAKMPSLKGFGTNQMTWYVLTPGKHSKRVFQVRIPESLGGGDRWRQILQPEVRSSPSLT